MIYIYDKTMFTEVKSFKRYGLKYKLERKFRMGERTFYSYIHPGTEKLLVVPGFAEQYTELETLVKRYPKTGKLSEYLRLIKRDVDKDYIMEDYPNEDSVTGVMKHITADYKDIRVTFDWFNDKIVFSEEFEIVQNNLFGNGIVVLMHVDMEK